jgi:hypothetical protein
MALRACPTWDRAYGVTPQTYIDTLEGSSPSPGGRGLNSSFWRVRVL